LGAGTVTTTRPPEPPHVRRARLAIAASFLMLGLTVELWFVHIPVVVRRLALEPAILGLALLNLGLGSLVFQPIAGIIVSRLGSDVSTRLFL
jgi:hypothetical protein